jgi:hypothetical protein
MPGLLITLPLSAVLAWLGGWALWRAARQWTGHGPARPVSERMRVNATLDSEDRMAFDRSLLAFGLMMIFFAVFIADIGIAGPQLGHSVALGAIGGLSFLGMMISTGLFLSIKNFNRPKVLVPPALRGEPGAIAGRRRRREILRSKL